MVLALPEAGQPCEPSAIMSDARRWITLTTGLCAALGATQACLTLDNQDHCYVNNAFACADDEVCDPCTSAEKKHGCVPVGTPLADHANGCEGPGVGTDTDPTATTMDPTMSSTVDPTVTTTMDPDTTATDGDTETTTGPPPMCNEPDGTFEGTCEGNTPFCLAEECSPCSNENPLAMCDDDPGRPVCAPSGACVQCTSAKECMGGNPYCDPVLNECVPCSEHAHCGDAACNLFTGECVAGPVAHVGMGQTHSTLGAALGAISAGGGGTIIVHAGTYDEALVVGGGAVVAFLANEGDVVQWRHTDMVETAPQLRLSGDATVLMDEIDMRLNPSPFDPALRVDGSSLWVDRGIIAQNSGVAVLAQGSADVRLRNCFVAGAVDGAALDATGSSMTIQFTTVGGGLGNSNAIRCDGTSPISVSDSIVLTRGGLPEVDCAMLTANHTVANEMLAGTDNFGIGPTVPDWFTNYNTGDFHLTADGQTAFEDYAEWNEGDPSVDIDGDDRPTADPTSTHAGADLP